MSERERESDRERENKCIRIDIIYQRQAIIDENKKLCMTLTIYKNVPRQGGCNYVAIFYIHVL